MNDERRPPDLARLARTLLDRAADDLAAAELLAAAAGQSSAITGFHAQQAVEKAYKAVLAQQAVRPPRTHDLVFLDQLLTQAAQAPPVARGDLAALVPFAVELRYGDPPSIDVAATLESARAAVAWARSLVRGA
jgi:HEPN domain-containing protein